MRILYLVHDLNDAAVARRVGMLLEGGADVELAGFYRGDTPPAQVRGVSALALDRSYDAQLGKRAGAVVRQLLAAPALAGKFGRPDLIVARNLEMLAIAVQLRGRFGGAPPPIVYECLDIHRLMLSQGIKGRVMRALERCLLSFTRLILVSSPAFAERYFEAMQGSRLPWLLVENKAPAHKRPAGAARTQGPPWRIGWFGMLRCARSLSLLADLVARSQGKVEVLIAGRPARTELPDFDAVVASTRGVDYVGPYAAGDLADLYGKVHFAWAIDYFEEGLNSAWLLPNRLYEGAGHGAVPIALAKVQTACWLAAHDAGVLITDPAQELPAFFRRLGGEAMDELVAKVDAMPARDLFFDTADCVALVDRLGEVVSHG